MTLSMAVLAVHSMRIVTRIGLVSLSQAHQQVTTNILNHLSSQLVAAGILNDTTALPLPQPPQSCKYNPQLCRLSLPWLYGSVISLTCALGALKTIARVRKDFPRTRARDVRYSHWSGRCLGPVRRRNSQVPFLTRPLVATLVVQSTLPIPVYY